MSTTTPQLDECLDAGLINGLGTNMCAAESDVLGTRVAARDAAYAAAAAVAVAAADDEVDQ
jgi:hypothetical protein